MLFEVLEAGRENGWWLVAGGWWLVAGGCESGAVARPAVPDRKGFPHPCGSATPSRARRFALRA
ncbi:hypothetical protein [Pantoea agglomerans]|uniref:hypothetical protein n=1 Tax=Enterobacter agglomerans TaxID=549 RepID=UPI003015B652